MTESRYTRLTFLQESFVRIPKARDWLQADKEHPLLIQRRDEKNSFTANQQKLQHIEYVQKRIDKSKDDNEKKHEEKLKSFLGDWEFPGD